MDYLDATGRYRSDQPAPQPPFTRDESAMLLGFLERQRATFAWKVGGLDENGLRARLGISEMTLGGMLRHLARFEDDMSREWLLGEGQIPPWSEVDWDADPAWDWRTGRDESPEILYPHWQDAVNRARDVFTAELLTRQRDMAEPGESSPSPRYVLLNMIEEYARHNGHADLMRESVDGLVGHDPPE
jgi:hypothetical protein